MMKRRLKISALLAATCVAALPRAVWAQAAEAPPAEVSKPTDSAGQEEHAAAEAGSTERPVAAKPAEEPAKTGATVAVDSPAPVGKAESHGGDRLPNAGYVPGYRNYVGVGLAPFIPRVGALPGGLTPSFGSRAPSDDWSFSFSGFMSASVRASINTRE